MHPLFDAQLINGEFGDPGVYVDFRDERRALLFDVGDLAALPPRKLLRLSHLFVSHRHMDHFSGFDRLLRVVLGRKARIVLTGGPGMLDGVGHKLAAYTWNLVHRYTEELVLDVRELGIDGVVSRAVFSSRTGFERDEQLSSAPDGDVLHDELAFRVRGRFVDHGIPCLAFVLEEKARIRVARDRLVAAGLATGSWLREFKRAVLSGMPGDTPIAVEWRDRDGVHAVTRRVDDLRPLALDVVPGRRVGYVTDIRYTEANLRVLEALLGGIDLLFIESVFLDAERDHAARKHHLTARQAGTIARRLGARSVVSFHFSPRYEGRADALRSELATAFAGDVAA
jgi:ribonuclease Z